MIPEMTAREKLAKLNTAIGMIEEGGAQEYRVGNRLVRRADLATLYKERRQLQQDSAAEESSGGCYVASYVRG